MKVSRIIKKGVFIDVISTYFFNLHYFLLFTIITFLFCLPLFTIGPSLISFCACCRHISEHKEFTIANYLFYFRQKFKIGLFLSFIIISSVFGIISSNIEILVQANPILMLICRFVAFFILVCFIYFPFAAYECEKITDTVIKSIIYITNHFFETIINLSISVIIIYLIKDILPVFLILIPSSIEYGLAKYIINNNIDIENKNISSQSNNYQ